MPETIDCAGDSACTGARLPDAMGGAGSAVTTAGAGLPDAMDGAGDASPLLFCSEI